MDKALRVDAIRDLLVAALRPEHVEVTDDSHRHAGHEGARDGRGHFSVAITSEAFSGKSPIARHRLVYESLGGLMQSDIHALSIKARAPKEA